MFQTILADGTVACGMGRCHGWGCCVQLGQTQLQSGEDVSAGEGWVRVPGGPYPECLMETKETLL